VHVDTYGIEWTVGAELEDFVLEHWEIEEAEQDGI